MKYRIADFIVEVPENPYHLFNRRAEPYRCEEDAKTDLYLQVGEKEVIAEMAFSEREFARPNGLLHTAAVQRAFAEQLPQHNAFLLHSACFDVDGVGVAFAAHSGTGKTTHMMLWQQLLGNRMTIINGDKPIVRFFDKSNGSSVGAIIDRPQDGNKDNGRSVIAPTNENAIETSPFAYGTPWNGKEQFGCNMRTPIKHICFIERAEQNSCELMNDSSEAIVRIFKQVYMPKDPAATKKTMELINRLIGSVQLWKIKCNMENSAAVVAYNTIFGK